MGMTCQACPGGGTIQVLGLFVPQGQADLFQTLSVRQHRGRLLNYVKIQLIFCLNLYIIIVKERRRRTQGLFNQHT